jgi:hypothetical protein
MGYKDFSSNLSDIHPRRMTVLDHFPFSHYYLELKENVFPIPISPLENGHYYELREIDHSSNPYIHPRRVPTCPLSMHSFHLGQRLYQNIYLSAHLWRYTREPLLPSGLYHGENNARSQCALTCHGTTGFY